MGITRHKVDVLLGHYACPIIFVSQEIFNIQQLGLILGYILTFCIVIFCGIAEMLHLILG